MGGGRSLSGTVEESENFFFNSIRELLDTAKSFNESLPEELVIHNSKRKFQYFFYSVVPIPSWSESFDKLYTCKFLGSC